MDKETTDVIIDVMIAKWQKESFMGIDISKSRWHIKEFAIWLLDGFEIVKIENRDKFKIKVRKSPNSELLSGLSKPDNKDLKNGVLKP